MGTVIFDLDGTLADTVGDIHAALDRVLVSEGRAPLPRDRVRNMVGLGGRALLRLAWRAGGDEVDERDIERLFARFMDEYDASLVLHTTLFPGCVDALDRLRHHALAVATNKPAHPADVILRAMGVRDRFGMLLGGDSLPTRKPDPLMIHTIRGRYPGAAVLVGDSGTDAKAAENARIPMIFVRWGYPGPDGLPAPGPYDVESFDEVPDMVERALRG